MALADKIIYYRKCRGWSQEDLAEQLNVSRQSVSKWESAASVPELDKIIQLAQIFGVTTDTLLLDAADLAESPAPPESREQEPKLPLLTYAVGRSYAELMHRTAKKFAPAVAACILSVVPLILLAAISDFRGAITEGMAAGIGVTILLVVVAAAVAVFITGGMQLSKYEFIEKEPFEADPELIRWAEQEKQRLTPMFTRHIVIGVVLCILAVIPLILLACTGAESFHVVLGVALLLFLVAVAVYLFISGGMPYGCYNQLLQVGDYSPEQKRVNRFSGPYWCVVTAVYLLVSFLTGRWDQTWLIWVCAGILFGGICAFAGSKQK